MRITEVRVAYGRVVTDGLDGKERSSVELVASVEEGDNYRVVAFQLADEARHLVRTQLKQSTSEQVLQAVETPEEREARWDRERDAARMRYEDATARFEGAQTRYHAARAKRGRGRPASSPEEWPEPEGGGLALGGGSN